MMANGCNVSIHALRCSGSETFLHNDTTVIVAINTDHELFHVFFHRQMRVVNQSPPWIVADTDQHEPVELSLHLHMYLQAVKLAQKSDD